MARISIGFLACVVVLGCDGSSSSGKSGGDATSSSKQDTGASSDGTDGSAGTDGVSGSDGSDGANTGPAQNCESRCGAVTSKCGIPTSVCAPNCPTMTESVLVCLEGVSGCDEEAFTTCLGSGGTDGSTSTDDTDGSSSADASDATDDSTSTDGTDADDGSECAGLVQCVYNEFESGCDEETHPYYFACCHMEPAASLQCVASGLGEGYCCVNKS